MAKKEESYLNDVMTIFLIWKDFIYEKYQIDNPFIDKDESFLDLVDSVEREFHKISSIIDEAIEEYEKNKLKKDIIISCIDYITLELEYYIDDLPKASHINSNVFRYCVEILLESIQEYVKYYFFFCVLLSWEEKVLKEKLDLSKQLVDFNSIFNVDKIFTRSIFKEDLYGFKMEDSIKTIEDEMILKIYTETNTNENINLLKEGLALFKASKFLVKPTNDWNFSFLNNQKLSLQDGEIYTILNDDEDEILAIYEKNFFKDIINDDIVYSFLYKEAK